MTYATQATLTEEFTEEQLIALTNLRDSSATTVNTTVLNRVLSSTGAFIDSFLSGRYSLPFASVPQVLIGIQHDLVRYELENGNPRPDVLYRYEMAVSWLNKVAKGIVNLGVDAGGDEVTSDSDIPKFNQPAAVFNRTTLADY